MQIATRGIALFLQPALESLTVYPLQQFRLRGIRLAAVANAEFINFAATKW